MAVTGSAVMTLVPSTASASAGVSPLSPTRPPQSLDRAASPTGPLFAWLGLQGAALGIALARIPLSSHYLPAGDRLAIDLVLTVQIAGSAALLPLLLRNARTAAAVIATAWPFVALAAGLSAMSAGNAVATEIYVTAWLAALSAWRAGLGTWKPVATAATVATGLAVGGVLLWYLASEFAPAGTTAFPADGRFGPLLGALNVAADGRFSGWNWAMVGIALTMGAAAVVMRLRLVSRTRTETDN